VAVASSGAAPPAVVGGATRDASSPAGGGSAAGAAPCLARQYDQHMAEEHQQPHPASCLPLFRPT
jgi:hypothetical protein